MSAEAQRLLTGEEYLAFDRESEIRHEFVDGEIFALSGASRAHNLIGTNMVAALHPRLRRRGCEIYANDMRTRISIADVYTYPDLVIVGGEPEFADEAGDVLENPKVIVEILSPSTEGYDRGRKAMYYRSLPSLEAYLLVAQEEAHVELYTRHDGDHWLLTEASGLGASLELSPIGVELALTEIYDGIPQLGVTAS